MPTNAELYKMIQDLEARLEAMDADPKAHKAIEDLKARVKEGLENLEDFITYVRDQVDGADSITVDKLHRALWKLAQGHPIHPDDIPDPGPDPEVIAHAAALRGLSVDDYLLWVKDPETYQERKANQEAGIL